MNFLATLFQWNDNYPAVKHWFGIVGTTAATIAGWLPSIASLVAIVWGSIQIYSWVRNEWRAYKTKKKGS